MKPGEFSVLWLIDLNPQVRQGTLARRLRIKPAHMTKLIRRFEADGYVHRRTPDQDRRAVELSLTARAERIVTSNTDAVSGHFPNETARLSADEAATLGRAVAQIHRDWSNRHEHRRSGRHRHPHPCRGALLRPRATMAMTNFRPAWPNYFKNPAGADGMLPTVQETADYYRERKIGAVIFPVDAERETGFRRYSNEDVAEIAAENCDILIPFAVHRPGEGQDGRARGAAAGARFWRAGVQVSSDDAGVLPQRPHGLSIVRGDCRRKARLRCFTPARPVSAPGCRAAWGCG